MKNAITLAFFGVAFTAWAALPASAETPSQPDDQAAASTEAASHSGLGPNLRGAESTSSTISPARSAAALSEADPFAHVAPLGDADMAQYRGGESITVGNQTLKAITSGNVLNGNFTAGSITLSDGALANFNGVGNFAINTGAQVSLQSGMNLVINIAQ